MKSFFDLFSQIITILEKIYSNSLDKSERDTTKQKQIIYVTSTIFNIIFLLVSIVDSSDIFNIIQ